VELSARLEVVAGLLVAETFGVTVVFEELLTVRPVPEVTMLFGIGRLLDVRPEFFKARALFRATSSLPR